MLTAALLASVFRGPDAMSAPPAGYPRSYRDIVAATVKERRVVVYANADLDGTADLIGDFMAVYPGVEVVYHNHPALSGVGFLYLAQDVSVSRDIWKLIRALGPIAPALYTSTSAMIDKLDTGEHLIAYNAIGSYVLERTKSSASLGIVFPADYTHVMSRIAFIARDARHPNAARLLLDYLLSQRGQALLARRSLSPVRNDMLHAGVPTPRPEQVQAIRVGQGLLANLYQLKRNRILREWRSTLGLKP